MVLPKISDESSHDPMNVSELFIRRPVATTLLMIALLSLSVSEQSPLTATALRQACFLLRSSTRRVHSLRKKLRLPRLTTN